MDIRLHPEKGLNPVLGICPKCGKENGEILLLGVVDTKYECKNCGLVHIGRPRKGQCIRCKERDFVKTAIQDGERIPSGLCAECQKEDTHFREIVRQGGVYFRCRSCGAAGVVKPEAARPYRENALRVGMIQDINDPMGIEFDEANPCPRCDRKPVIGDIKNEHQPS